jgi:hypothetical protein
LSVLKVITRREGVGAFSASMAPAASTALVMWAPQWRGAARLHRFRRLTPRYERRSDVHEAFLTLGCALITWRYLKREF